MTPTQLLDRTPESEDENLSILRGLYYDHLPELPEDEDFLSSIEERAKLVDIKLYKNKLLPGGSIWRLGAVFYCGLPCMIFQNAGRGGRDHVKRFIISPEGFRMLLVYLWRLSKSIDVFTDETYSPEQEIPDLDTFYGRTLCGDFS